MAAGLEELSGSAMGLGRGDVSRSGFSHRRELSRKDRLWGLVYFVTAVVLAKLSKADTPKRNWDGLP